MNLKSCNYFDQFIFNAFYLNLSLLQTLQIKIKQLSNCTSNLSRGQNKNMQKCYICKGSRRQLLMLSCSHDACIKCAADNYFLNCVQKAKPQQKESTKKKNVKYFCENCLQVTVLDEATINQLKNWYISNVNQPNKKNNQRVKQQVNNKNKKAKANLDDQNDIATINKNKNKNQTNHSKNKDVYKKQVQIQKERNKTQYYCQNQRGLEKQRGNEFVKQKNENSNSNSNNYQNNRRLVTQYPNQDRKSTRNYRGYFVKDSIQNKNKFLNTRQNNNQNRSISNDKYYDRQCLKRQQFTRRQNQRLSYRNYQIQHYPKIYNNNKGQYIQTSRHSGSSQRKIFGSIVKRGQIQNNIQLKNQIVKARQQQRKRINSYKSQEQFKYIHPQQLQKNIVRKPYQERQCREISSKIIKTQKNDRGRDEELQSEIYNKLPTTGNFINAIPYQPMNNQFVQYHQNQFVHDSIYYSHEDHFDQISRENYSNSKSTTNQHKNQNLVAQHSYSKNIIIENNHHNKNQRVSRIYNESEERSPTQKQTISKQKIIESNRQAKFNKTLKCKIHQDEEIIYYCLDCKVLICSECALYGNHKDHNIHTLKKASLKLKETLYNLITELNGYLLVEQQKEQQLIDQIKQIKVQCNKEKQRVKFSFQNFLKNIQNKYAQILQQLQESQTKSLSTYNQQLEKCKNSCEQFVLMKNNMKSLFDTFGKGQNAPLAQFSYQNEKVFQSPNSQTTVSNNFNNFVSNRVYRQFDDVFQQNSMTSSQKNFFNSNIEQLQAKINDYEEYMKKIKLFYDSIIYPKLSSDKKRRKSVNSLQYLSKQSNNANNNNGNNKEKSEHQMQQSLRFSQNSLLLYNTNSPQKDSIKADFGSDSVNIFTQNNIKSINLIIQNQGQVKLGYVDVIVDSIRQIEQIVKQFKIEYKSYEIRNK